MSVLLVFLLGLALGAAVVAWWCRRSAAPAVRRLWRPSAVDLPPPFPTPRRSQHLWTVGSDEATGPLLEALTRALSQNGAVLLVPRPERRGELESRLGDLSGVFSMEAPRPSPGAILRAEASLAHMGAVTVLVDGPDALEAPSPDEMSWAVMEELMDLAGCALVVVQPSTVQGPRPPDLHLDADGSSPVFEGEPLLRGDDGRVFLAG